MRADMAHPFLVSCQQWRTFTAPFPLAWQRLRFSNANKVNIPREPGIYAFTVEYADAGLPSHGFIMYFGITGIRAGRNLRSRYGEYLREKTKGKRLSVQMMLVEYEADLFFHYVPLNVTPDELKSLETKLIDAVMPPVNEGDYSAEMKRKRRAM